MNKVLRILWLLVFIGLSCGIWGQTTHLSVRETGSYIRFVVDTDNLSLINGIFPNISCAGQYEEFITDYSIINRFKENQVTYNVYGIQLTAEKPDNNLTRPEILGQNNNNYNIPDMGYVSSSFNMTSAPAGAVITGITYNVRIAHDWVSDLRVAISNNVPRELVIWNRLGGDTDGGNDSDTANDDDIELTWIWSTHFNGDPINGWWYLDVDDMASGDTGYIDYFQINFFYNSITAPSPPNNLTAIASSATANGLSWSDNSNNETGFKIQRKTGSSGTWSLINTTSSNTTSYSNTGLSAGTSYYYRVCATNSAGDSNWSNEAIVPAAPSNLVATSTSSTAVSVTWTDNANNETGGMIQRKIGTGNWSNLQALSANATSYNDTGLTSGTTYWYRVYFISSTGASWYSNEDDATPVTYTISGTITLNGTGLSGVSLGGFPTTTTTNASGAYSCTVNHGWSGTVTPSKDGYVFSPTSREYSSVLFNLLNQDYSSSSVPNDDPSAIPIATVVSGNYPNPFNPTTTIEYSIKNPSHVIMGVYNSRGALVKMLVDAQKTPGFYQIAWNGEDNSGNEVSSGVYFIVLKADSVISSRKMLMMK